MCTFNKRLSDGARSSSAGGALTTVLRGGFTSAARGIFFLVLSVVSLASCALPRPTAIERQSFVSERDVLVSSLIRDAQLNFTRGRFLDSEGELRQALHLVPGTTQLVMNLGQILSKNGQIDEAEQLFNKLIERKPFDVALSNFIGESYYKSGEFDKAEVFFDRSLELIKTAAEEERIVQFPEVLAAQQNKAVSAFRRFEQEEALCLTHEIFVATPGPETLIRLVRVESAFGRYAQVENRISDFLSLNPGTNDARLFLLRAISRIGRSLTEKALEDLEAAQKRDESIGDYSLELLLITEAFVPAPPLEEGEEPEELEEQDISLQTLSDGQRLYMPLKVLEELDRKLEEKKELLREMGVSDI